MTRWQRVAETNPSATPEQRSLFGLMAVAEIDNTSPGNGDAVPAPGPGRPFLRTGVDRLKASS